MRIYFEQYYYDAAKIVPYLGDNNTMFKDSDPTKRCYTRVGYIFVSTKDYSGPIFILPKSFLIEEKGRRLNVLGMNGIYPEDVIDTDDPENPLELSNKGTFLPEMGLWLFRSLCRFRQECHSTPLAQYADLDSQLPEDGARDKDFLSTALELIDFLKDHRNLFTQISLINHSGHNKIDWHKTVKGDPFFYNGEPWYLDPAVKEKTINIDDTLIVLYYSVLKYLRDKFKFPVEIGEVPYTLQSPQEIQRLLDTGIGSKEMKRIRHKYFRDDLKYLWGLLDSFFTYNSSNEDKEQRKEYLLVRKYEVVFEKMIDSIISDTRGVEDLKKQGDGKLIDHIFRFKSLLGNKSEIYYIGDSKHYSDNNKPEGVALYKQFTYAKNTIQYHIDQIHINKKGTDNDKTTLRYRDSLTEGYNITPNFFIRGRVTDQNLEYDRPGITICRQWNKDKGMMYPPTNKHFEDRLFDRDTLILREFSINLLFLIAAYAGYEDECWSSDIHNTIREEFIKSIDKEYEFFIVTPHNVTPLQFDRMYVGTLNGKTYMLDEDVRGSLIVAFEKSEIGLSDKDKFLSEEIYLGEPGQKVTYDIIPTSLEQLSKK